MTPVECQSSAKKIVRLRHLARYNVLLCVSCGYCVLPNAIDRHLKSIHRSPWYERRKHVKAVEQLQLASWEDVIYPGPDSPPIPGLPVLSGHICIRSGCQHLCATLKRMQAHWTVEHSRANQQPKEERSRPVKLQTFFRGGGLRYFVVTSKAHVYSPEPSSSPELGFPMQLARVLPITNCSETTMDWLLTKEFHDRSFISVLPAKSTRHTWRDNMLQVGAARDFLRYAMLSVTANHVAFEYPESRRLYRSEADRYRNLAIQNLPAYTEIAVEQDNLFEYFNFQRLMTLCYMSKAQQSRLEGGCRCAVSEQIIPEWVSVQRQGRKTIWKHRGGGRISSSMHAPMMFHSVYMLPAPGVSCNPDDHHLQALEIALPLLSDVETDVSCLEALQMLRRVWELPFWESVTSFRDMALMWTARVSDKYVALLQSREPASLIVFAHYCVLWKLAEPDYWYMKGHAERILMTIAWSLSSEHQHLISWPMDMLLSGNMME